MENNPRTDQATGVGLRNRRPTIACLAPLISIDNGQAFWSGLTDAARKRDAKLICFPGGCLSDPRGFMAQANVLYELVNAGNVEGVVSWGTAIGSYTDTDGLGAFHERYRPLPVAITGGVLEGFPSLLIDSYTSMRAAVDHLIKAHGYRRVAFIRGPETSFHAQERYRAYVETLEAHGLPVDPRLVTQSLPWDRSTGREAMRLLLDKRGLRPHTDFEAVVGADDDLLLGALEVLQARGVRVPGDVAAVGADNLPEGKAHTPPLTSVASPYYEMGYRAAEMLLSVMGGAQVARETITPQLVIRQSCGCLDPAIIQAAIDLEDVSGETLESCLASRREQVLSAMAQAVGESSKNAAKGWGERLLEGFAGELKGGLPDLFSQELNQVLRQTVAAGGDVSAWQGAVSALRRQMTPYLDGEMLKRAENLWHQARVMIGETAQRAQAYQAFQAARQAQTLREIETTLITTLDVASLMDVLAQNLPRLGIPGCYLALYEDPQPYKYPQPAPEWSRLVLAYTEQGRVELEPGGRRFRSCELVPEGMLPREQHYNLVVEPLYFRENQLGFVLFEVGPHEGAVYETLRAQISSALQGAMLVRQVKSHSLQLRTAAEVSRAASSILDLNELLPQMVNLIQQRFGLYYTGLFLMDAERRYAVLRAGTDDAGRQMMAREHKLALDENSMIGWCILNGQARIALDVGQDATHFANPLLPETRSELALPLITHSQTVGAVTVQSTREAAFTEADVTVLQTMADQVANAIANARLFEQAEAALTAVQQSERLMRSLIDATPDWIFIKDQEHRYRLVNQGYAAALHLQPEDFIGKNDLELGFPEELVKGNPEKGVRGFWQDDRLVMDSGQTQIYASDPATIDGVVHIFNTIKAPLRDASGQVWGVLAFARDITELKRAEEELSRSAKLLDTIIDTSRDLIYIKNTKSEFLVASQAVARLVGVKTADELIGKSDFDFFPYDLANKYYTDEQAIIQAGEPLIDIEEPSRYPDGTPVWLLTTKIPYRAPDGTLLGLLGIGRDITERKRAEEQMAETLRETERLYAAVSADGWKTFRQSGRLPQGYLFDRTLLHPAEQIWEPEIGQAVNEEKTITTQSAERAVAVTPLAVRGAVIGALGVYDDPAQPLPPEDLALIEAVSEQVALALESARLFEQTQHDAERERAINRITGRIRGARSVEEVLAVATQELRLATQASRSVVEITPHPSKPASADFSPASGNGGSQGVKV